MLYLQILILKDVSYGCFFRQNPKENELFEQYARCNSQQICPIFHLFCGIISIAIFNCTSGLFVLRFISFGRISNSVFQ